MFIKKTIFSIFGIFAFLIFNQLNVFACSCPTVLGLEQELKWKLKEVQAIFSGKVVEINKIPQSREISVKIRVEKLWKGSLFEEMQISTPESSAACGYSFEIGKSYLVFANNSTQGNLTTGLCLDNKELVLASEELKILGKGKKPKRSKSSSF